MLCRGRVAVLGGRGAALLWRGGGGCIGSGMCRRCSRLGGRSSPLVWERAWRRRGATRRRCPLQVVCVCDFGVWCSFVTWDPYVCWPNLIVPYQSNRLPGTVVLVCADFRRVFGLRALDVIAGRLWNPSPAEEVRFVLYSSGLGSKQSHP